jgi:diacylglycerol kinase family enzyme
MDRRGRVEIIVNARSGAPGKDIAVERAAAALRDRGIDARIDLVSSAHDLHAAAARAAEGDADVVVAGGGDGTVAAVAAGLLDSPKTFGVLPLGTFNYFARRLGVPLELEGALDVIATSTTVRAVSVGEVNGRMFLNNASIGLYPAVLKQRESTYRRVGRSQAAAYLSVAAVMVRPPGFLNLELAADGVALARQTPLLFVGVNPHQLETFGIPGYDCVNDGRLAAYITRPLGTLQLWQLGLRGLLRGLHGTDALEVVCARELVVQVRRRRVRVAMDGEVARLRGPLRFRIREKALRVLTAGADAPVADESEKAQSG